MIKKGMCQPCCLIVGCPKESYEITKPLNFEDVGGRILCPHCSKISRPIYKKEKKVFSICFIKLCPCETSDPYMACSRCKKQINISREEGCSKCHVVTPFDADFCPNCGTNKNSFEHVRKVGSQ